MTESRGREPLHPETAAVLGGRSDGETSLAPVLYPTSTFEFHTQVVSPDDLTGYHNLYTRCVRRVVTDIFQNRL